MKQAFVKYLLKRSFQWQSLFSKTNTLNLMKNFASKYQEQLLELNLHQPVFTSVSQHNNCSHSFGLRYIDDIFFIQTHGKEQCNLFLKDLNEFHPNLKFMYESSQNSVDFLDLDVSLPVPTLSIISSQPHKEFNTLLAKL